MADKIISCDSLLAGINELKKSPWFNRGKDSEDFQHSLYLERKDAVEIIVDLCIKKEPEVSACIGCYKEGCKWRH